MTPLPSRLRASAQVMRTLDGVSLRPSGLALIDRESATRIAAELAEAADALEAEMTRTVVVEVKNEVLGDGEFWRGPENRINEIRSIPAKRTAELVVKDGKPRKCGMWHVRIVEQAGVKTGVMVGAPSVPPSEKT